MKQFIFLIASSLKQWGCIVDNASSSIFVQEETWKLIRLLIVKIKPCYSGVSQRPNTSASLFYRAKIRDLQGSVIHPYL